MKFKEWVIPIRFEGVALSPISIAIDHLGMYDNLPEISEETSLWLWRFTICRGRNRTDETDNIKRAVNETLELINRHRAELVHRIAKIFDGEFTEEHLALWIKDLETIRDLTKGKSSCTWECD